MNKAGEREQTKGECAREVADERRENIYMCVCVCIPHYDTVGEKRREEQEKQKRRSGC